MIENIIDDNKYEEEQKDAEPILIWTSPILLQAFETLLKIAIDLPVDPIFKEAELLLVNFEELLHNKKIQK